MTVTRTRKQSDLVDAAMCAWEHVLEELRAGFATHGAEGTRIRVTVPVTIGEFRGVETRTRGTEYGNKWHALQGEHGMAELRSRVADLAPAVDAGYAIAQAKGFDAPFDWDFVPAFMEKATDENGALLPEWRDIARKIGEEAT